jgi:hypothetical protein
MQEGFSKLLSTYVLASGEKLRRRSDSFHALVTMGSLEKCLGRYGTFLC